MMNIKNVDSDKIKKTKIQTRYFYFLIRYVTRKSAEPSFRIVNMKKRHIEEGYGNIIGTSS